LWNGLNPRSVHLESLLELLPLPSLLVDEDLHRIWLSNKKVEELTGFGKDELQRIHPGQLLPGFVLNGAESGEETRGTKRSGNPPLVNRNAAQTEVVVKNMEIDQKGGFYILTVEPFSIIKKRESDIQRQAQILDAVKILGLSFQQADLGVIDRDGAAGRPASHRSRAFGCLPYPSRKGEIGQRRGSGGRKPPPTDPCQ
jgi:hypothetical protein